MDIWDTFVQKMLMALRNGAPVPEYFGCLIPILSREIAPVLFPSAHQNPAPLKRPPDEFLSLDARPKQQTQAGSKQTQAPPVRPTAPDPPDSPDSHDSGPQSTVKRDETDSMGSLPQEIEEESSHQEIDYAEEFKAIGDRVVGDYWYPVQTDYLQRLTIDSKWMMALKTTKFNRLREKLLEDFQNQTSAPDKLRFVRSDKGR
jgi:hypothetical protein